MSSSLVLTSARLVFLYSKPDSGPRPNIMYDLAALMCALLLNGKGYGKARGDSETGALNYSLLPVSMYHDS